MKLFLLGYYGYGNIGDEALLTSILTSLKQDGRYTFKVLSYNAQKTSQDNQVEAVSRGKNINLIRHIVKSDVLIVGGGSIIQDVTSSKSLYYYLSLLFLGKLFGKRVIMLGNGYGPVNKWYNRAIASLIIKKIDCIVARDEQSYQHFIDSGAKKVYNGVDCAFNLNTSAVKPLLKARPYVAISLRPWRKMGMTMRVIVQLISDLNQRGYDTVLVAMKSPDDDKQMASLLDLGAHVHLVTEEMDAVLSALRGAKLVIAMRLHALILATMVGRPIIAISYDPKIDSFIDQVFGRTPCSTETIDYQIMMDQIEQLLDDSTIHRQKIATLVKRNAVEAAKQIKYIENCLLE